MGIPLGAQEACSLLGVGNMGGITDGIFELFLPVVCEGLAEGCPDVVKVGSSDGERLPDGFLGVLTGDLRVGFAVSIVGVTVGSVKGADEINASEFVGSAVESARASWMGFQSTTILSSTGSKEQAPWACEWAPVSEPPERRT